MYKKSCKIIVADILKSESIDTIYTCLTYNNNQIEWLKAGSSLNFITIK